MRQVVGYVFHLQTVFCWGLWIARCRTWPSNDTMFYGLLCWMLWRSYAHELIHSPHERNLFPYKVLPRTPVWHFTNVRLLATSNSNSWCFNFHPCSQACHHLALFLHRHLSTLVMETRRYLSNKGRVLASADALK